MFMMMKKHLNFSQFTQTVLSGQLRFRYEALSTPGHSVATQRRVCECGRCCCNLCFCPIRGAVNPLSCQFLFEYQRRRHYGTRETVDAFVCLLDRCLTFKNLEPYIQDGRTATLQMLHFIFFFLTNIGTEYFKHAAHSPILSSKCPLFHNVTFFYSCIMHILHTGVLKFKCKIQVCKSVHHRTIQINHQSSATIFQFIILRLFTAQHVSGGFPPIIRGSMTAVADSGFTFVSW